MKPYLPGFLRKKMRPCSSSSSSSSGGFLKSSDSLEPSSSPDSNSDPSFSSALSSSSFTPNIAQVSSKDSFFQVPKISVPNISDSTGEIVVLPETTGKARNQFSAKLPLSSPHHELEEAFLRFDANHDGKISTSELGSMLRSLGDNPSDEELVLMMKEVDRDGDGFIDLQEFILLNSACSSSGKEDLHRAFLVFDADADGKISAEELHNVLGRVGESCTLEECSHMIRGVDMDGDGFVDFQEFCTMMAMH